MVQYVMGAIYDFPFIRQLLKNFTRRGRGGAHCWLENRVGNVGPFPNNNQLIIGNLEIYTLYNVYNWLSMEMAIVVFILITLVLPTKCD